MPTTASGLRYPAPTDRVNLGATNFQNLAGDVQNLLIDNAPGIITTGFRTVDTGELSQTGWVEILTATGSPPSGPNVKRCLVLGLLESSVSIVGNVEAALFIGNDATPIISAGGNRVPNPTANTRYIHTMWAITTVPSGATTWRLKMRNLTAGTYKAGYTALAVVAV